MHQLPNLLTLFRLLSVPFIAIGIYQGSGLGLYLTLLLFVLSALTDWLDGYYARKYQQESLMGTIFDPISDKVLALIITIVLMSKDSIQGIHLIPALLIVAREIVLSGLREQLASYRIALPVMYLAKVKTTLHYISLSLYLGSLASQITWVSELAHTALWLTAFSALYTAMVYYQVMLTHVRKL